MHLNLTPEWPTLENLAKNYKNNFNISQSLRAEGSDRTSKLCVEAPYILIDTAKQAWNDKVLENLVAAVEKMGLSDRRAKLFLGEKVNLTEGRPAVHALWRKSAVSHKSCVPPSLNSMLVLAEKIRARTDIDDVIHIGIGGSGLGPEMALAALKSFHSSRQRVHIVSNLDGHDLHQTLQDLNPNHTLLVVVSKSWSTSETLKNAESAIAWLRSGGVADISANVVAVSSKPELAQNMGAGVVLDMPDGIGGRYSLWSAVGLPLAVSLGASCFMQFLHGGAAMDEHFLEAPLERNVPVILGLLDVWNTTFLGWQGRCVVPYHHGLRRLPAYLQQLEMESNGKRTNIDGELLSYQTAGITWGEEGSNSQHAFFQWLHQGTRGTPLELLLVKNPDHPLTDHHTKLLANGLAQAQALMLGKKAEADQLAGHQDFPGNRTSTIIGLESLIPASLGALLAMYEHRTFVAGVFWGINSFDQYGVELGKNLAADLESRIISGDLKGLDLSTAYWVNWMRS